MKFISALFASAILAASAGVAAAGTIHLASFGDNPSGTAVQGPSDAGNTALIYLGSAPLVYDSNGVAGIGGLPTGASSTTTYDLTTGLSPWTAALGDSYWVAQNPNDSPGNGHVETNNTGYLFSTSFQDLNPADSSGTLTILADDTASVFFNGFELVQAATTATNGTCDSGTPNCTAPMTFLLPTSDFVVGTNYLAFGVLQEHGSAEGLDFVGSVNVTPEPDSLLLLGTGLAMLAGFTYYRRVQA